MTSPKKQVKDWQTKDRYCELCNYEDLASVCIWCHKKALKAQAESYIKNLDILVNEIETYEANNPENNWTNIILGRLFGIKRRWLKEEVKQ